VSAAAFTDKGKGHRRVTARQVEERLFGSLEGPKLKGRKRQEGRASQEGLLNLFKRGGLTGAGRIK